MSPRLLYLLTVGAARRDLAIRRGDWKGWSALPWRDSEDLETAELRGYGKAAVGDAMIRRGL
jgi:hypothetical protein